ncbi:MAG: hypothetical protein AAGF07_04250 [Patescibacteria group bacterium]
MDLLNNIKEVQAKLLLDLSSDKQVRHNFLLTKYGNMEPQNLIVKELVELELIPAEKYKTICIFLNSGGRSLIGTYTDYFYSLEGLGKINRINDGIYEAEVDSKRMMFEGIQRQVQKLVKGESVSEYILSLYNKALEHSNWEYLDELVTEFWFVEIKSLIGERDPFTDPYSNSEALEIREALFSRLSLQDDLLSNDDKAKMLIENWLKGKVNLKEKPDQPEYLLSNLLPKPKIDYSNTDFPPELMR